MACTNKEVLSNIPSGPLMATATRLTTLVVPTSRVMSAPRLRAGVTGVATTMRVMKRAVTMDALKALRAQIRRNHTRKTRAVVLTQAAGNVHCRQLDATGVVATTRVMRLDQSMVA